MSVLEMKVPSPGESISEVEIAQWLVSDGDYVEQDQPIAEIDSDKATLELPAEASGVITLKVENGEVVKIGQIVCLIDTSANPPTTSVPKTAIVQSEETEKKVIPQAHQEKQEKVPNPDPVQKSYASGLPSPSAKKLITENAVDVSKISGSGKSGRILKMDVVNALSTGFPENVASSWGGSREQHREKMSMLRRKIAERLVSVKNQTAMLTTFNEVDMQAIMNLRNRYKDRFAKFHEINLGFMSFFTKAVTEALNLYPAVNAQIDGNEIVFFDYADVGIAVSSPKGLMVPVLRNAEQMSLAQIETEIKGLAVKAREGKITPDEMTGGTFTITNGGVFGSMMSTPIINPPQSAILGMHNIVERPVAINGKVEIRPMMYLALSYDHRIIDGKESVGFLVKVKEMIEHPERILFGGKDPNEILLGL